MDVTTTSEAGVPVIGRAWPEIPDAPFGCSDDLVTALGLGPFVAEYIGWPTLVSNPDGSMGRKFKQRRRDYDIMVPNLADVQPLGAAAPRDPLQSLENLHNTQPDLDHSHFRFDSILSDPLLRDAVALPLGHARASGRYQDGKKNPRPGDKTKDTKRERVGDALTGAQLPRDQGSLDVRSKSQIQKQRKLQAAARHTEMRRTHPERLETNFVASSPSPAQPSPRAPRSPA